MAWRAGRAAAAVLLPLLLAIARPAAAHDSAESRFEARPAGTATEAGLHVVLRLDTESVTERAGAPTLDALLPYLDARFTVTRGAAPCARAAPRAFRLDDGGGAPARPAVIVDVVYRCGATGAPELTIESTLFHDELIPHLVIGTVRVGGRADRHFFTRGERVQRVPLAAPAIGGFRTATPPPGAFARSAAPAQPAPTGAPARPTVRDDLSQLAILLAVLALGAIATLVTARLLPAADQAGGSS